MPDDNIDRLKSILKDVAYCRGAVGSMGGGQPPTVHAAKYADDVGFLLRLLEVEEEPGTAPPTRSPLEVALEHDAAGRTERRGSST